MNDENNNGYVNCDDELDKKIKDLEKGLSDVDDDNSANSDDTTILLNELEGRFGTVIEKEDDSESRLGKRYYNDNWWIFQAS